MAVTIFVLFGDDARILWFPPSADRGFAFFTSFSFILFILEMILHFWAKSDFSSGIFKVKGYAFSFFFWLDLLAVLSMVPDVPWLASSIGIQDNFIDSLGECLCGTKGFGYHMHFRVLTSYYTSFVGTKAGKAGKIGAKSSRVIRMARLVRLVKLYKVTSQRSRGKALTTQSALHFVRPRSHDKSYSQKNSNIST